MSAADVGTLVGYGIMPRHVGRGGGWVSPRLFDPAWGMPKQWPDIVRGPPCTSGRQYMKTPCMSV